MSAVAVVALVGAVAACASVADLDVEYNSAASTQDSGADVEVEDSRQLVRESSVEFVDASQPDPPPPTTLGGCEVDDAGDGNGCDPGAGKGCCVGTGSAVCIEQAHVAQLCTGAGKVFITCRWSAPDSPCCYRKDSTTGVTASRYASDCGGDPIACLSDGDCPTGVSCQRATCGVFEIGQCGSPPPSCP